jgi:hypothetical protein
MGKLLMLMLMLEWCKGVYFHDICSMYDTGFNVLSMKINYLAPFKHKHKHQKLVHEN